MDITYLSGYYNDELKDYIQSKTVPGDISTNFVPLIECEYKSFELTVLNKLMIGPVLLSIIQSYKNHFRKIVKSKIIKGLIAHLNSSDRNIVFEI